jgi:type II secretory pathway component PulK
MPPDLSRRRGSALILVLWCLLFLTIAVFGVVEVVELSIDHASHEALSVEARGLSLSGLALGLNPQLLKDDPLLAQTTSPGRQFKVSIESEGARINLNYALLSGHRDILENLFTQWGLQVIDADHVADCLYDWVTPGDMKSLNGAKATDYIQAGLPYTPTGQPFDSFEQVRQVIGVELLDKAHPGWEDAFTLWSAGPLNVNEAPAELIAAVFGIDPGRLVFFVNKRNGLDGIPGTADDVPVNDVKTFQGQLGISDLQMLHLGNQISFSDPNRRVESVGQAEGTQVMISVVTRLNTSPVTYLLWSEQ